MGLLDDFSGFLKTPEGQGVLSGVFGLAAGARKGTPWNNLGRGGLAGLQGYSNAVDAIGTEEERKQKAEMNKRQMELFGLKYQNDRDRLILDQDNLALKKQGIQKSANEAVDYLKVLYPNSQWITQQEGEDFSVMPAVYQDDGKGNSVLVANQSHDWDSYDKSLGARIGLNPQQMELVKLAGQIKPTKGADMLVKHFASTLTKPEKLPTIGFDDAMKAMSLGMDLPEYTAKGFTQEFARNYIKQDQETRRRIAEAGSPKVYTGGEKGFKNEMALRGDFRAEPIYKAHTSVEQAYRVLITALNNPDGAGDLAAATKFMKILDPDSVVRESELGMAMQSAGYFDRVANFFDYISKGNRLTPTQRQQFKQVATAMFEQSADMYNQKHEEYANMAKRHGFDSYQDLFGPKAVMPKQTTGKPLPPAPQGKPYGFYAPDGKAYFFPSQDAMDKAKKQMGI